MKKTDLAAVDNIVVFLPIYVFKSYNMVMKPGEMQVEETVIVNIGTKHSLTSNASTHTC